MIIAPGTEKKEFVSWAVVVAQLVERSLPTPEIHSLYPDICKFLSTNGKIEKTKIKKKWPGMDRFFFKFKLSLH